MIQSLGFRLKYKQLHVKYALILNIIVSDR